jgi:hypothetical protein
MRLTADYPKDEYEKPIVGLEKWIRRAGRASAMPARPVA